MAEPIFVIGRNRSGTKWLSNILANHKDVIAVQREGAGGIIESNILSTYPKHFDLSLVEERTAFEILFKNSNFHICSGIEDKFVNNMDYYGYYDFFGKYMNALAFKNNSKYWLQKASSDKLKSLLQYFPNARILIIQRKNIVDNVISTLLVNGQITLFRIIVNLNGYWRYNKIERNYKNKSNVYFLTYEDLKNNSDETIQPICKYLGITFNKNILNRKYEPNTSYVKINKVQFHTKSNILKIKFLSNIIRHIPLVVLTFFENIKSFLKKDKTHMFIVKTFEEYRGEIKK